MIRATVVQAMFLVTLIAAGNDPAWAKRKSTPEDRAKAVYEILVQATPQGRLPYLDDLLAKKAQGGLSEYVKERIAAGSCK